MRIERRSKLGCLFRRKIGDDCGIAAGGSQVGGQPTIAALAQRVVVRHERYRRLGRAGADQANQVQGGIQRRTAVQCAGVGALHGCAVGERIRERDAYLKAVRASIQCCLGQRVARRHIRETRRQIRKQPARFFGPQPIERAREAVHARYSS